jgi:tRNA dimethylallyltransferase
MLSIDSPPDRSPGFSTGRPVEQALSNQPRKKISQESRSPLVVLLGPTAVGKTEISLELAGRLDGEIVSADSRLFYRGMDIGTAKPTRAEQARVPHHLIDVTDPGEVWSLAVFQQAARQAIAGIHARGRLPFLVGGTGQYIRAVIEGWQVPRAAPNPRLRAALENWAVEIGSHGLHARLASLDPQAAAQMDYRNLRRTVRALEVILGTGRLFSAQRGRAPALFQTLLLGLTRPRPELYARIDARIDAMLAAGFVAEVQALLDRGYSCELPTLSAIGYREIIACLQGEISQEEAVARMKRSTRRFVRRQANWFKESDPDIHWFEVGPGTVDAMEAAIRDFFG